MNIVGKRNVYFMISGVAILIGLAVMAYNIYTGKGAFNYNVDFTGGMEISVDLGQEFNNEDIVAIINEAVGDKTPQVQRVLGTNRANIKMQSITSEERTALTTAIKEKYGVDESVFEITDISPSISGEMRTSAILAVFAACLAILVYITIRFRDFRTASSTVLALMHDSVLVILTYAVFRIPLNYSFVAVVLTILGFSINASIVIFDRVRENRRRMNRPTLEDLINTSVTQTVMRCIYTSMAIIIVTACMYVNGVPAIRDFTLPIVVGVVWGTYSSIFLSGSIYYMLMKGFKKSTAKA